MALSQKKPKGRPMPEMQLRPVGVVTAKKPRNTRVTITEC